MKEELISAYWEAYDREAEELGLEKDWHVMRMRALSEAYEDIRRCGLNPQRITSFSVEDAYAFAYVSIARGRKAFLTVDKYVLERASYQGLLSLFAHELLHTIPGCDDHGAKWHAAAALVNKTYGGKYNIKETCTFEDFGIPYDKRTKRQERRMDYLGRKKEREMGMRAEHCEPPGGP